MLFILGQMYFTAYAMNKMKTPSPEVLEIIDEVHKEIDEQEVHEKENNNNPESISPKMEVGMDI